MVPMRRVALRGVREEAREQRGHRRGRERVVHGIFLKLVVTALKYE